MKIELEIAGKTVKLTLEEARAVWRQLAPIFAKPKPSPYPPLYPDPWPKWADKYRYQWPGDFGYATDTGNTCVGRPEN